MTSHANVWQIFRQQTLQTLTVLHKRISLVPFKVKTRKRSSNGFSYLILKKFSGKSPCIFSVFCYLHLLLLALLVSGLGNLRLEEKIFVTIAVEEPSTLGVNGVGDGKWGLAYGPLKGAENSHTKRFVLVVLTLNHAFQLQGGHGEFETDKVQCST